MVHYVMITEDWVVPVSSVVARSGELGEQLEGSVVLCGPVPPDTGCQPDGSHLGRRSCLSRKVTGRWASRTAWPTKGHAVR